MAELFSNEDINTWLMVYSCYANVIRALGKKKPALSNLDDWFQKSLPLDIKSRHVPYLTRDELMKLMQWKLTRGKFRPRLTELVQQNSSEEVESTSKIAIAALPDLENAVKTLTKLKAVGPATASAILCAAAPNVAPFMADEAVLAVPNLGKLDYTLKHYLKYAQKMQGKAEQLNALQDQPGGGGDGGGGGDSWTAHKVEITLWTFHYASKLDLLPRATGASSSDCRDNSEREPPLRKKARHSSP